MSATPTAALVEEAQSMTTETLIKDAMDEMQSLGIDNLRAKGAIILLSEALRRAEAERDELRATVTRLNRRAQTAEAGVRDNVEACKAAGVSMGRTLANAAADMYLRRAEQAETARDAALKQSAAWEIQAQDMRDRLVRAEAERDAQSEQVLRLTGERDEAKGRIDRILDPPIKRMNMANGEINVVLDAPEMARIMATTFWEYLDERKAKNYVEMCFARPEAPTKRVIVTVRKLIGRTPEELREAVAKERDELLEKIKELESTRNLLLTENAQLQQMLSRPDPVVHETPVDGVVPCCGQKLHDLKDGSRVNEGPLVNCDRMRLLSRVGELSSENLLLTAENERLQQEHNAYCRKLANDGLTVASRLQRELDAVRAENETLHYLLNGVR